VISASVELQTGLEVTPRGTVTGIAPGRLWIRPNQVRFNGPTILTTAVRRGRSLLHGLRGDVRNEKGTSSDPYLPGTPLVQYQEGGHLRFYTDPEGLMQ
jgi:hypothetical protein